MRSLKPLVLVSLGAVAATTEVEPACDSPTSPASVSTIYITVPASPTTETLYVVSQANSAIESAAAISNAITVTVTNSVVSTQTISVVQVKHPTGDDTYSFTVDNDTTSWFNGETPPSTISLVSSTAFITLEPVIASVATTSQGQSATSTSYLTLLSTIVEANPSPPAVSELASARTTSCSDLFTKTTTTDVTVTETLAHSSKYRPSASAGLYFGQARSGWNATMTTLVKSKGTINPSLSVVEKATSLHGTSYSKETRTAEIERLILARNGRSRLLKPRQVGVIVIDTIDGHVVSWTNEFDGRTPSTSEAIETPISVPKTVQAIASSSAATPISTTLEASHTLVPVTATAPAFGPFPTTSVSPLSEVGETVVPVTSTASASESFSTAVSLSISSSVQTILSSAAVPTTTIGAYPWDLSAAPSASETSISVLASLTVSSSLLSVSSSVTSTSLGTATTSATSACDGAVVSPRFVIDFDDLPSFSTGSDPNDTDAPPIFNPYRKLYWEEHFGYVPPPTDPFPPHSPPQLAVYQEAGLNINSSPDAGLELVGEIGAGPRAADSAYWIDAYSAWLGCANSGPGNCKIEATGYAYGSNESIISQSFTQPPCPGLKNCSLALVEFAGGFSGLSGLQIIATVAGEPVTWYMDDLSLGWSNNTCAAHLERSSSE
ncbi:hypothetical protein JMJ35_000598 [Cladonia borealis]|uniref:DUF7371 domain-containing protein n=1 Tax=Cladonia borealis TaxID=184061 RepID=A0AA39R9S7_9LECA|nr:hypothetical protein JMJ35_000598 [Cladonia borealis]